jgi:hypothetical protein
MAHTRFISELTNTGTGGKIEISQNQPRHFLFGLT